MIKLNKLEAGLFTESQMQGIKVLHFDFIDDGEKAATNDEGKPTEEALVDRCTKVLDDIKKELDKNDLQEEWVHFLLGEMYGVFTGDCMASPDNMKFSSTLLAMISHMSHDIQEDTEKVEFRKKPPLFVFYGSPAYSTGTEQFYENFNVVFCNVSPNELPSNMFALLEMQGHVFCTIQAKCSSKKDIDDFYDNYICSETIKADPNRAVAVISNEDVLSECLKKGVRCCHSLSSSTFFVC